ADAGVVEAGGDRVRAPDRPGLVLEEIALAAVQHAHLPGRGRGRVRARLEPAPRRLDADQLDAPVAAEGLEEPQGVAPAADTRDARVRQPPAGAQHLAAGLVADHRLELAHHERVGVRSGDLADTVEGVTHSRILSPHRLVMVVLERYAP